MTYAINTYRGWNDISPKECHAHVVIALSCAWFHEANVEGRHEAPLVSSETSTPSDWMALKLWLSLQHFMDSTILVILWLNMDLNVYTVLHPAVDTCLRKDSSTCMYPLPCVQQDAFIHFWYSFINTTMRELRCESESKCGNQINLVDQDCRETSCYTDAQGGLKIRSRRMILPEPRIIM